MKTTGNLGLKKPDGTDIVDITDLNGNMDILDTAIKAVQDHAADTVKHITAAERSAWNAKASTAVATVNTAGLMAGADKSKLDSVAQGANNYVHPNHTGDVISSGDGVTAIAQGVIVNTDINPAAGIDASKIGTGVVSNAEFGYLDGVTSGIQGQINKKANLANTPQQTTADIVFYVRTDGNDNNVGNVNSSAGAFKTIQKAINSIPYHVDHAVSVNVQQGIYDEDVKIADFNGNTEIYINGAGTLAQATGYSVRSFSVYGCTNQIVIQGFTATTTTRQAFAFANSNFCQLWNCRAVVSTTPKYNGVETSNGATVRVVGCQFSNRMSAIFATQGSTIISVTNTGTGNDTGIAAAEGGLIRKADLQPVGGTAEYCNDGGIITIGVLNPWGDNTYSSRSSFYASKTSNQSITKGVLTKVDFQNEVYDMLGEYDNSTSTFTASKTGLYFVECSIVFNAPEAVTSHYLLVYKNATWRELGDYRVAVNTGGDVQLSVSGTVFMNAGENLQAYAQHHNSVDRSISNDATYSRFKVARIA